mgnify:CR=1 FL=1
MVRPEVGALAEYGRDGEMEDTELRLAQLEEATRRQAREMEQLEVRLARRLAALEKKEESEE